MELLRTYIRDWCTRTKRTTARGTTVAAKTACPGVEATTLPLVQYVGVTIGIFVVSFGISMVEADLSVVLGFVGSTVGKTSVRSRLSFLLIRRNSLHRVLAWEQGCLSDLHSQPSST